ncbi:NUDIX hydrolase [Xanthobacter sp. TB0139]|uniref:NUDIX hydrolase n=1 Tax=Xanthobacter sp. TB0139 TaxID=3459178 RepID=UPI00403A44D4
MTQPEQTQATPWGAGRQTCSAPQIFAVQALHFVLEPGGWPQAEAHHAEIETCFAACRQKNPHLWNGEILMLDQASLRREETAEGVVLHGAFRRTDFASFLWWRMQGWPDMGLRNAFSLAALEGADGGFVLGRMGAQTSSAGHIYFPGGTPDLSDVTERGYVDLAASSLREMAEETGLHPGDIAHDGGFIAVEDGPRLALLHRLVFAEPADALADRIRAFLGREALPELADMVVVHREEDLLPAIAPFTVAYMRARWAGAFSSAIRT